MSHIYCEKCIDILLPSLTKLVNLSLQNGIFPNPFKQAIVTPLLKKSTLSKEDLKSYRPVSGLSFLSKLVEHVVPVQIRCHLDYHDLGNTFQPADKVGHLTKTALLCIKNEIHLSLSKGMPTTLVRLDLSAAFDTIDHDTLLSCLSVRFGFAGSVLKWFRSYLQDRFQSVKIGSAVFDLFKLKFRIPQGFIGFIIFKTLVLVYKYVTTGQPKYFAPYISLYKSAINTRRSSPKICSSRLLIIVHP